MARILGAACEIRVKSRSAPENGANPPNWAKHLRKTAAKPTQCLPKAGAGRITGWEKSPQDASKPSPADRTSSGARREEKGREESEESEEEESRPERRKMEGRKREGGKSRERRRKRSRKRSRGEEKAEAFCAPAAIEPPAKLAKPSPGSGLVFFLPVCGDKKSARGSGAFIATRSVTSRRAWLPLRRERRLRPAPRSPLPRSRLPRLPCRRRRRRAD